MKHLRDDDLVLYQGGEIRTAPTRRHLHACRGCRERLQILDLEQRRLSSPPAAPAPLPEAPSAWRRLLRRLGLARSPR